MGKQAIQIINVPLDLGASRRGANTGPMALKQAGLINALESLGSRVSPALDVPVPYEVNYAPDYTNNTLYKNEILTVCKNLAQKANKALELNTFPLVLGGDHSISMGSIAGIASYYKEQHQKLGVIWFDAHGDMNTPETSPSGNLHGMPLAHLLGFGDQELSSILDINPAVCAEDVVIIGVRDIDEDEQRLIDLSGVTVFTMQDINNMGIDAVTKKALYIVNKRTAGFHLSFDVDGCDPAAIPATGTKVANGVTLEDAHNFLKLCAQDSRMCSMDVVELNPFLDTYNESAKTVVSLTQSAFA